MVRIINAFRGESPIGNVLTQLGQQLFGDQAGASINREQAYALQRGNAETDNLMRQIAEGGGVQALGADPVTQAMLIGSGYDPQDFSRIGLMGAATGYGARDPRTTNWTVGAGLPYGNTAEAFDLDLAETARNNNLQSGDRRYGVDQNVAQDRYEFDQTPQAAMVNGQPAFVPRVGAFEPGVGPVLNASEAQAMKFLEMFPALDPLEQRVGVGAAPSLDQTRANEATRILGTPGGLPGADPNTQEFIGARAAPGTSWNYITPDGKVFITNDTAYAAGTDARGRPLPPDGTRGELQATDMGGLAPAAKSDLDKMEFALYRLDNTASQLIEAIDAADPRSFGLAGAVADLGRGAVTAVANLAGLLGVEEFSATALRQRLASAPQDPNDPVQPGTWDLLFNPAATELQTLGGIFLWQAAAALAGQGGRELSNADMTRVIEQFGSPTSWGTDQVRYREKIVSLQNYARDQLALIQTYRANQGAPPQGAAATPAPTTTTGTLTPNPDGTLTWTP